jgi:NAD(P)-dependent dehydrogenase (short-subunit alcohol dehydrogenase family)
MTQDQTAVVTGAGSGIGRACAHALAARGLHVIAVGRRVEPLMETVDAAPGARAVSADISTDEGLSSVADAAQDRPVRAVVHAAGQESVRSLGDTDRAELERVFATNVFGAFLLTRALADRLADGAGVAFIASIAAVRGRDRHAAYGASKAALIGLTHNLAVELAPTARVNCVLPGPVQTPMLEEYIAEYLGPSPSEDDLATIRVEAGRVPLRRIAEPAEIAASVVHLVLDATATTGAVIATDLGYTAR